MNAENAWQTGGCALGLNEQLPPNKFYVTHLWVDVARRLMLLVSWAEKLDLVVELCVGERRGLNCFTRCAEEVRLLWNSWEDKRC